MEYTATGIDAEIIILNGRGLTFDEIVGELGVTKRHIARTLGEAGTLPYHTPIAAHRPGKGERPARSDLIYRLLRPRDLEAERRAVTAIMAANNRIAALKDEHQALMDVRAEACAELYDSGLSPREIAAVCNQSHETVRSDLRRLERLRGGAGG